MATVNRRCTAEGKQQVKLISRECDLSFVTQRMRFAYSWHLLPLKYGTKSPINFNGSSGAFDMKLLYMTWQKKLLYEKKAQQLLAWFRLSCSMQNNLVFSVFLNHLYYQSLQYCLVEGGILFYSIFPANLFLKLLCQHDVPWHRSHLFLKTILKDHLSLKVKNTMKTNFNFKRNYMASSKCTVNHNCLLLL